MIPLTNLTPAQHHMSWFFFCVQQFDVRRDFVHFVDIGDIVDYHSLNLLFIIQNLTTHNPSKVVMCPRFTDSQNDTLSSSFTVT